MNISLVIFEQIHFLHTSSPWSSDIPCREKISIGDSTNSKVELLEQGQGHVFLAEGNSELSRKQNQEDSLQFNASNYQSSNVIQPTSPIHIENFLELKDGNNYNLSFSIKWTYTMMVEKPKVK